MERALLGVEAANGGFPEPPDGPVRVVSARHLECGAATRVRLPDGLPAHVVRRVQCGACAESFETEDVVEVGVEEPAPTRSRVGLPRQALPRPRLPRLHLPQLRTIDPSARAWRIASVPIAAVVVVGGLMLLQRNDDTGGGSPEEPAAAVEGAAAPAAAAEEAAGSPAAETASGARDGKRPADAQLVRGSSFSVALPQGWERVPPEGGATFAAVSASGDADAALWIERDPSLDFARFESRSLDLLRALAGSARVVERVPAPRPDATVVRLAAVAPPDQPEFEVTLRASGPYRYYLATTVQPDASREAIEGAELIHGSFTPEAAARAGS